MADPRVEAHPGAVTAPAPDRFYELIRALLPGVRGLTAEAIAEYDYAIGKHEAEHTALVAKVRPVPDKKTGDPA